MNLYWKKALQVLIAILLSYGGTAFSQPKFVEIDGKPQRIFTKGEGKPVVIFVTGLGTDLKGFYKTQVEISKVTRTLSYDRAGLGKSMPIENDRSIDNMVRELHEILLKENIKPPYLLVGHSFGGHILRLFTNYYPQKVAGLIFIDPSSEGFREARLSVRNREDRAKLDSLFHIDNPNLPEGIRREKKHMYTTDIRLLKNVLIPDNIPVTLLTSSRFSERERNSGLIKEDMEVWVELHEKMISSAPQAKHILTEKSGHVIHVDEPQLVISEIEGMIEAIKSNWR